MIVDLSFSLSKLKTYSVFLICMPHIILRQEQQRYKKGRKQWRGGLKEII